MVVKHGDTRQEDVAISTIAEKQAIEINAVSTQKLYVAQCRDGFIELYESQPSLSHFGYWCGGGFICSLSPTAAAALGLPVDLSPNESRMVTVTVEGSE